jgi:hypothetical protein
MNKSGDMGKDEAVRQLNEDIFLALFRKGAYEYLENGTADDNSDPNDTLSDSGEKRIMRLIKKELRREKTGKAVRTLTKVAVIFLIVLAVCAVTIMSVEAFRVPVFNLFVNANDEATDISVGKDMPGTAPQEFASKSIYMPAGFELTSTEEYAETIRYIYSNAEGRSIIISRYSLGSYFGIDTEDAETGQVDINGSEALYSIKNGVTLLTFKTDEYAYKIEASVELPEVVEIAKSLH